MKVEREKWLVINFKKYIIKVGKSKEFTYSKIKFEEHFYSRENSRTIHNRVEVLERLDLCITN